MTADQSMASDNWSNRCVQKTFQTVCGTLKRKEGSLLVDHNVEWEARGVNALSEGEESCFIFPVQPISSPFFLVEEFSSSLCDRGTVADFISSYCFILFMNTIHFPFKLNYCLYWLCQRFNNCSHYKRCF